MRSLGRGYLAAVLETARAAGHEDQLGRELGRFVEAIWAHEGLRRVLTDPSVGASGRRGVVSDLLVDQALEETASLVGFLVGSERPADLPAVVAQAARTIAEAGDRLGEPEPATTDRSLGRAQLRGYAERVFQELSTSAEIDEVEDELFRFARLVDGEAALRSVLANPSVALEGRVRLVDDLLLDKVQPATVRLVRYVLGLGRLRDLVGILEWLVELAAGERGRRVAEVHSAVPLDQAEQARLGAALGRVVGRPVEVRVVVDPAVVGGMLVTVGDLRIDGTIRSRLDKLREALAGSS